MILLAACPASTNTSSVTLYDYFCANGTPEDGGATEENSTRCTECNSGYTLTQAHTCVMRPYVCDNGIPSGDDAPADNITKCQSCTNGYVLTAAETCNYAYVCSNGTPSDATDATAANITKCQSCTNGYVLTAAETCNHAYICNNGTPTENTDASGDNVTQCADCKSGYKIVNSTCVATQYTCANGTPDSSDSESPAGNKDVERCHSCSSGYYLSSAKTCLLRTATAIAPASRHTCAILDNGTVKCWGSGIYGRLGYGDTNQQTSPLAGVVNLGIDRTATAITTGEQHSCVLLDNGTVKCWGNGANGRLGYGNTNQLTSPPPTGTVNLGTNRTATAIDANYLHTCALLDNRAVKCWGPGNDGRLGYGNTNQLTSPPTSPNNGYVNLGNGRTAAAIVTGQSHTCALLDNGAVKCWGSGAYGRLGYGNTNQLTSPPTSPNNGYVNLGNGRTAAAIVTGQSHTCAILDNDFVKCWGWGASGRLGYDTTADHTSPLTEYVNLGTGRTADAITAGHSHTCVILDNGAVKCWGAGGGGRLGYGNTTDQWSPPTSPNNGYVNLGTGRTATAISAGDTYTCVILDNGAVKCWGNGNNGKLGYGNTADQTSPPTSPNNGYVNLEGN